ncbi:hypothetical protein PHMEG_00023713 [Phytophthora megakarya]|uniref:Uncharacterized protein n=1 Tax=Phytophthora megakarya TaxID=4795 RepID=A0A225VG61_9STRA|nr:hypothetical protein PHMEG_00023713 [Phytophthora megakarya]
MHLGRLKRLLDDGRSDSDAQYNMVKNHFVIDLDDGKSLGFRGTGHVKYCSVASGRRGITICVLLRGGRSAKMECPMLFFTNKNANYPIQGLPDTTPGVRRRQRL